MFHLIFWTWIISRFNRVQLYKSLKIWDWQKKIASTGYWTHNTNPTIKIPATLPTQPICQSMSVLNFQTLLKSCSIEPEMIQVQFKDILFNKCLGGWVVKVVGFLIVGLVLWVQYPVEAIFFYWFWNPVMSILYKNDRNVRSVNLGKTRMSSGVPEKLQKNWAVRVA